MMFFIASLHEKYNQSAYFAQTDATLDVRHAISGGKDQKKIFLLK